MILSSCGRLLARAWGWAYTFACLNVTTYCNSFSQTEEVWINETCLKAKIKASAWKTIRKTQYSCYKNYFQVFRGFSKKSYPEIHYVLCNSHFAKLLALVFRHAFNHLFFCCSFDGLSVIFRHFVLLKWIWPLLDFFVSKKSKHTLITSHGIGYSVWTSLTPSLLRSSRTVLVDTYHRSVLWVSIRRVRFIWSCVS